tara:strand:+ start:254 stop:490 length:237 start_codon:yes stop_codon:yes gene_type:complete
MSFKYLSPKEKKEIASAINALNVTLRKSNLTLDSDSIYLNHNSMGFLGLLEDLKDQLILVEETNDYVKLFETRKYHKN